MSPASKALPEYLKKYLSEQDYEKYTPRDQAAWRYIMRRNRAFFSHHAVPVYQVGLKKTGIPLDRIPKISEMDDCLAAFGWGAVPVRGFIPPAAFLEFQARGVLPIASDMRTVNHIAYTPAPDIVHEAAGHAPIIADPEYAKYLFRYAKMAQKAIQSAEDIRVYEAIRFLSDIKENPDTPPEQIAVAEKRLQTVSAAVTHVSEATKVARMAWWTVEYGLVGKLEDPLIYGAGLLSSVGESHDCLSSKVRKLPLTIDCVETSYNITEPQPQLFVTPNMAHLNGVLDELERTLSFVIGGPEALGRAKQAETVNTAVLDSGLELSGQIVDYVVSPSGDVEFFKLSGPVQIAREGKQLAGHGRERHGTGFSSPLGRWRGAEGRPARVLSDSDLAKLGVRKDHTARITLTNGFVVEGKVADWLRSPNGDLCLVTWRDCTVHRGEKIFFEPAWGEFDLAVGEKVTSVFGGPADMAAYGDIDIGKATTVPSRTTPYTAAEKELFAIYQDLRGLRQGAEGVKASAERLEKLAERASKQDDWLLSLELLELVPQKLGKRVSELPWALALEEKLREQASGRNHPSSELIENGLELLAVAD